MTPERRSKIADYIAKGIRFAEAETRQIWPKDMFLLCKSWGELSEIDNIIGLPILIADLPWPYDFFIVFHSDDLKKKALQKSFLEYLQLYDLDT